MRLLRKMIQLVVDFGPLLRVSPAIVLSPASC